MAVAYVLPPLTGLVAYLRGRDADERFHGLQSVVVGIAWPATLHLISTAAGRWTWLGFVAGAVLWLLLLGTALAGRALRLPGLRWLERLALEPIRDEP